MKKHTFLILLITLFFGFTGCKKTEGSTGDIFYTGVSTRISSDGSYGANIKSVNYSDGYYYLCGEFFYDDYVKYMIYKIDGDGNKEGIELNTDGHYLSYMHQSVVDGQLICIADDSEVVRFDIVTGNIINSAAHDEMIYGVGGTEDGYILLAEGKVVFYDMSDNVKTTIESEKLGRYSYNNPICSINDKYYVVCDSDTGEQYYELDLDNNHVIDVLDTSTVSNVTLEFYGEMAVDSNTIYKFSPSDLSVTEFTDLSGLVTSPPVKSVQEELFYDLGDGIFARAYAYADGDVELITYRPESEANYSSRVPIKIAGYGINDSLPVKWAIYRFNTLQDEYFMYSEDYNSRFAWMSGVEAQAQQAELIKYWAQGNAPDIYYGFNFDYRSLYNAGLVEDMMPYIDGSDLPELYSDRIMDLTTDDDICYQVFAGYYLNGFLGLHDIFAGEDCVSVARLEQIAEETGITPLSGISSANIADLILRYEMDDFVKTASGEHILSLDELIETVVFATTHGTAYDAQPNSYPDIENMALRQHLLGLTTISDIYSFSLTEGRYNASFDFVGYPSVRDNCHVVNPDGLVAISSSGSNKQACWDFIRYMFDDDVQLVMFANGRIPVIDNVLERALNAVASPDTASGDYVLSSYTRGRDPVPGSVIEDFRRAIGTADTVVTYDWGLYNLICDELNSYDIMGKTTEDIAESLQSRIDVYVSENY